VVTEWDWRQVTGEPVDLGAVFTPFVAAIKMRSCGVAEISVALRKDLAIELEGVSSSQAGPSSTSHTTWAATDLRLGSKLSGSGRGGRQG
jgi:hypothetical protein